MTQWQSEDGMVHDNCVVFFKVDEEFGPLSNMAGGYPLRVSGILVSSSEALYQACRFPQHPDWQQEIITQGSPMGAKMKAKKDRRREDHSRPDWAQVEVDIMRWVLRVKLAQHFGTIAGLLRATADRPIVEKSRNDRVWGAVEDKDGILRGRNQLGVLLVELRGVVESGTPELLKVVTPPAISDFRLLGKPIETVRAWKPASVS